MPNANIKGGTNSSWRKVRAPRGPWKCKCGHANQGYHATCFGCNAHRPSAT